MNTEEKKSLGQIACEEWYEGKNFVWGQSVCKTDWERVAQAVRAAVLAEQPDVNQGLLDAAVALCEPLGKRSAGDGLYREWDLLNKAIAAAKPPQPESQKPNTVEPKFTHSDLLVLIGEVEKTQFRTDEDTGANECAMLIWNMVRARAGLPRLRKADLPSYCVTCDKYHVNPCASFAAVKPTSKQSESQPVIAMAGNEAAPKPAEPSYMARPSADAQKWNELRSLLKELLK